MSFACRDCVNAIITEVNCRHFGSLLATVDCECDRHISKEQQIRKDARRKFAEWLDRREDIAIILEKDYGEYEPSILHILDLLSEFEKEEDNNV